MTNPLQRPGPPKPRPPSPKRQGPALPELTLDIASREQEQRRQRGNVDLSAELQALNAAIKAAEDARNEFFKTHGYTYEMHGSYYDQDYYAVHPQYLCQWVNEGPAAYHSEGMPDWGIIRL